jgi:hypothetical protein
VSRSGAAGIKLAWMSLSISLSKTNRRLPNFTDAIFLRPAQSLTVGTFKPRRAAASSIEINLLASFTMLRTPNVFALTREGVSK